MATPKQTQFTVWYVIVAIMLIFWLNQAFQHFRQIEPLAYSEFLMLLKNSRVKEVAILDNHIQGELLVPLPDGRTKFITTRVEVDLAKDLAQYNVKFTGVVQSTWLRDVLGLIVPIVVFFAIWMYAMKQFAEKQGMGGGFLAIGKSKAKVYMETDTKVTFADVAGVDEAKEELREVIGFLKSPVEYGRLGGRIPKGVLLVGPPGTGKTLLARAVAGEAGVPFYSISGSEFVEMFVGVGAARVRDLFGEARKQAPAIIFIDELDALGRARGAVGLGGHDEKEQTLNQLLSEMDGFDPSSGLVLLAATNRPEILDPALLRAGRFDRQVLVDRPDKIGRVQILDVHLKKIRFGDDVERTQIAAMTPGFSGADLANLVNEAALLATRRGAAAVMMQDFTAGIERIVAGLEKKSRILNPREREVVAWHEMGHALVAMSLPGSDPVHKISIIPRGIGALGYTIQRPTEDRYLMTREELESKMTVLLGGRAAEQLAFGQLSTGAADDLQKVTDIARSMIMRYGMDEKLGHIAYEVDRHTYLGQEFFPPAQRSYSEETAREIDCSVRKLVASVFQRALEVLGARRATLDAGARQLLETETLSEADLTLLVGRVQREDALIPKPEASGDVVS